jgi:hypothetical protein
LCLSHLFLNLILIWKHYFTMFSYWCFYELFESIMLWVYLRVSIYNFILYIFLNSIKILEVILRMSLMSLFCNLFLWASETMHSYTIVCVHTLLHLIMFILPISCWLQSFTLISFAKWKLLLSHTFKLFLFLFMFVFDCIIICSHTVSH